MNATDQTVRKDASMSDRPLPQGGLTASYKNAPTRTVTAGGEEFAYRELGPNTGTPVIFLTHLAANLDNWDPRVVDGIAAKHHVIAFDNRGVGASSGTVPGTIWCATDSGLTLSPLTPAAMSVSMNPACTPTTRVPCRRSSMRSALVSDHAAALDAL